MLCRRFYLSRMSLFRGFLQSTSPFLVKSEVQFVQHADPDGWLISIVGNRHRARLSYSFPACFDVSDFGGRDIMLPQLTQNLLPSGLSNPQLGHFSSPVLGRSGPLRLTPHSPQNFWPSGFLDPQPGHFVAILPIPSHLCYFFLLGLPFRCFSIRSSILRFLLLGNLSWVIAAPPSPECPFFPMLFARTPWDAKLGI